ncbi:acyltransferase family protein [Silvibacterium acidisoli]|uniref:acyltransferase family protein n=1 Tax=Acidobacteriaceae bacterium ZG23-2 TaxID=2883246 RepID=UPI00406C4D65
MTDKPLPKVGYRADIDGLRAVAVLSVVFAHLGFSRTQGGYVGVDVFFVISGYLIGSHILSQFRNSTFSIVSFYERRTRRIIPALVAMLVVASVCAYHYLLPSELLDYARSLMSAALSVSNIYFWTKSGYFAGLATTKPLLHTWSLGVEEQFYIFFPLFLLVVVKWFSAHLKLAIGFVAAVSFAISAYGAYHFPDATFYLAHTRAWELLIGSLIWLRVFPELKSRVARELIAALGLGLILFAVFTYTAKTPFPGVAALAPCLGAAFIIAAGQDGPSFVGRVLSWKPIVFIGLISYSLYLWHWPLIVFQWQASWLGTYSPKVAKFLIIGVSLVLGTLSWMFVERPFRTGKLKLNGGALFAAAGAVIALFVAAGVTTVHAKGFASRFPENVQRLESYIDYKPNYREGQCYFSSADSRVSLDQAACLAVSSTKRNVIIVGDSHAAQLWYGFDKTFPNLNIMEATASGCRGVVHSEGGAYCVHLMNDIFSQYIPTHRIDTLVLASQWEAKDLSAIAETVEWARARNIKVLLFGPIIHYDQSLPRILALSADRKSEGTLADHEVAGVKVLDARMKELARSTWKVPYVSYFDLLCADGPCISLVDGGVPLQFDQSHLTSEGSEYVAQKVRALGLF